MSAPRGTKPTRGQCRAFSTSYLVVQEGPVMLAFGASNLLISGFQEGVSANWGGKAAWCPVKVRPERPGGTSTTPFTETFSLSGLGSNLFLQPLMTGAASSGDAEAFLNWKAFVDSKAQLVGRQTIQLEPDINATKTGIQPIGARSRRSRSQSNSARPGMARGPWPATSSRSSSGSSNGRSTTR